MSWMQGGNQTHLSWTAETDFYQNFWLNLGVDLFFFLLDTAQIITLGGSSKAL